MAKRLAGKLGDDLTDRQWQIMKLVINGNTAKQAARDLGIGHRTVEIMVANVKKRLGAKTLIQAAVLADRMLRRGK